MPPKRNKKSQGPGRKRQKKQHTVKTEATSSVGSHNSDIEEIAPPASTASGPSGSRASTRERKHPRRADDSVSFAAALHPPAPTPSSAPSSPSAAAAARDDPPIESAAMTSASADEGSSALAEPVLEENDPAALLVAQLLAIRGMSGPSLQPTSAPNPWVLPTNTDAVLNAAEEREESVEMIDAALSGAEDEEKPAVFESTDGPKPEVPEEITFLDSEEDLPNAAYFIGVHTSSAPPQVYASFGPSCRDARPTFGSLYQALIDRPGLISRILRSIEPSAFVGTSLRPVDPKHNFMEFGTGFRELPNPLEESLAGTNRAHRLQQVSASAETSAFLKGLDAPETTRVFALYFYPPEFVPGPVAFDTNTAPPIATSATIVDPAAAPVPPANPADPIQAYLEENFGASRQEFKDSEDGYQSAYRRCRFERVVIDCCTTIGIRFALNRIINAQVEYNGVSLDITMQDVVKFFGCYHGSFSTIRSQIKAGHTARSKLSALQAELSRRQPPESLPSGMQSKLGLLSLMLKEGKPLRFIADIPEAEKGGTEYQVVSLHLAKYMRIVESVKALDTENPQDPVESRA